MRVRKSQLPKKQLLLPSLRHSQNPSPLKKKSPRSLTIMTKRVFSRFALKDSHSKPMTAIFAVFLIPSATSLKSSCSPEMMENPRDLLLSSSAKSLPSTKLSSLTDQSISEETSRLKNPKVRNPSTTTEAASVAKETSATTDNKVDNKVVERTILNLAALTSKLPLSSSVDFPTTPLLIQLETSSAQSERSALPVLLPIRKLEKYIFLYLASWFRIR